MTSEVVIMNRRAIALAADSAVTVTSVQNGRRESKYFKGANKVFELSHHSPVALMIFNMADVHSVPWELIIKSYRDHLGKRAFPTLDEYAKDLFSYVENHSHLFPPARQEELFKLDAVSAAFDLLDWIEKDRRVAAETDPVKKDAARTTVLSEIANDLATEPLPPHFASTSVADAIAKFGNDLETALTSLLTSSGIGINPRTLAVVVVEAIYKRYPRFLNHTGIVIAGYADDDYFPGFVQYNCYGILLGKFIADRDKARSVTVDNGSHIQPFAMNDMVHTFMSGMSPDIFSVVLQGFDDSLKALAQHVQSELGVSTIPNLDVHSQDCLKKFQDRLIDAQVTEHYKPLTRAVNSLPVDEMASLAETLIMLESLKEKVTRPSESVGGPVDVAVITKGEGLVWIKRKHYFPAELNGRFLERQRQRLG